MQLRITSNFPLQSKLVQSRFFGVWHCSPPPRGYFSRRRPLWSTLTVVRPSRSGNIDATRQILQNPRNPLRQNRQIPFWTDAPHSPFGGFGSTKFIAFRGFSYRTSVVFSVFGQGSSLQNIGYRAYMVGSFSVFVSVGSLLRLKPGKNSLRFFRYGI